MAATSERDVAQALLAGLAGVSAFNWGWAELESAMAPPSLPLVTLTRLQADVDAVADMCTPTKLVGAITLESHAWSDGYEAARILQDAVRAIIIPTGWKLAGEQDSYDALFRAWRISAQWTNIGALTVTAPTPPAPTPSPLPPSVDDESLALFIPLHLYVPPVPPEPPPRAFSTGFDGGFA